MNRLPRTETLLVLACAAASAMLAASQFISIFDLTPPGGEALQSVSASDQHGYATLVLAVFALAMLVVGIATQNEQAARISAFAVAASGGVALLIFLVGDLPDANKVGTLSDESFRSAKAEPQAGFWLELVGSLTLAICGGALATLGPEKLQLLERNGRRRRPRAEAGAEAKGGKGPKRAKGARDAKGAKGGKGEHPERERGGFNWPSRTKS